MKVTIEGCYHKRTFIEWLFFRKPRLKEFEATLGVDTSAGTINIYTPDGPAYIKP